MKTKKDKINIVTLGCSKNLVDSEDLRTQLARSGFNIVHDQDHSDARTVIINTCGFIKDAKEESVNTILRAVHAKEKGVLDHVYVMGCLSQRYKKDLEAEIPDVDKYFGANNIPDIVKEFKVDYKKELVGERMTFTPKHYAYMKVSEGCDRTCAFCAIPLMRGRHVSKPMDELEQEARNLVAAGVKEIMLIAQDMSFYGFDLYGELKLAELLERLSQVEGLRWIRLHYVYPTKFPHEVLRVMRERPNICKYVDMPLQHITDNMLKIMRRGGSQQKTLDLVRKFRQEVPGIAMRTTLLVGHPGETLEDFEALKQFVRESRFDRLGVFTFSNEEDTHAYRKLTDDIPEKEKQRRADEIMAIQQEISLELNQAKVGKTLRVLLDRREGDQWVGRTEADSVEVDNEVLLEANGHELAEGMFVDALITQAEDYDLLGQVVALA